MLSIREFVVLVDGKAMLVGPLCGIESSWPGWVVKRCSWFVKLVFSLVFLGEVVINPWVMDGLL